MIIADRTADWTIRVGGLGVIAAVFGIMVFLAEVVVPLFADAEAGDPVGFELPAGRGPALATWVDEYGTIALGLQADGTLRAVHLGSGRALAVPELELGGRRPSAVARTVRGGDLAVGLADGTVALGEVGFDVELLAPGTLPDGLAPLGGGAFGDGRAVYAPAPGGQHRRISVRARLERPRRVAPPGTPITALDYRVGDSAERPTRAFAALDAAGVLRVGLVRSKKNLLTGKLKTSVRAVALPRVPGLERAVAVLTTERADQVLAVLDDGTVRRYDTRRLDEPVLAETVDLTAGAEAITAATFLLGEQSLVIGTDAGRVDVYFRLPRGDARSTDGRTLVRAHRLEPHAGAVRRIVPSQRGKLFVTADAAGSIALRHSTSEQTLLRLEAGAPPAALALAPREDGVLAVREDGRALAWPVRVAHPETTWSTLFRKVWYEGYPEPTFTWQSSSGEDSFEPKLSLVPLVFGTVKATVYSLLFALPIALLGAIYTSEFVHQRVRAVLKPTMELMASLPSVVLGFIAALILAPLVETWIAAVVLAFVVIPVSLLAGAYLWQLLPGPAARRLEGVPKLAVVAAVIGLGCWLALAAGPGFERLLFAGDFKAWANGDAGTATPFLFLLALPAAAVAVWLAERRLLGAAVEGWLRPLPRQRAAALDALRWLVTAGLVAGLAYLAAAVLAALGFDARGGVVGTYVQRNTLVVGFAMGFAVIPIIYTIAEDALNSVPEHLRAASLACGATPWQMAVTVILPTAMSGVFAAAMIGMGRAVGETMIVVMAAGNTPLIDWNVFNGLRALSANIAVELPEAVKDGTLYRVLFLTALVLFAMTFVVNTAAEVVRLRFRRRASQL